MPDLPGDRSLAFDNRRMGWEHSPEGGVGSYHAAADDPLMQIVLRDEVEQDLTDLADAVSDRVSMQLAEPRKR